MAVVDVVLLGVVDQAENERRHAHDGGRLHSLDGVPLEFGNTVSYADDARAHTADTHPVRESRHETFVDGGHQLKDVPFVQSGARERLMFVVRQTLQIRLRATEHDRVAERA